jgi:hypothetical protein
MKQKWAKCYFQTFSAFPNIPQKQHFSHQAALFLLEKNPVLGVYWGSHYMFGNDFTPNFISHIGATTSLVQNIYKSVQSNPKK